MTWAANSLRDNAEWEHLAEEPLAQSQIVQSPSSWASTHQFQVREDHHPQGPMLQAPAGPSALALADTILPQREAQTPNQAQVLGESGIHMGQPNPACSNLPAIAAPPMSWQDAGARGIAGGE